MKLAWLAAALAMTATAGRAPKLAVTTHDVTVYVTGKEMVPAPILVLGEDMASRIYQEIGIRLRWQHRLPGSAGVQGERTMVVHYTSNCAGLTDGALAAARPYEGSTIIVVYDRLRWAEACGRLAPRLLAHVLAHEIAHNLQGIDRHSETGIMKARWTSHDFRMMSVHPLPFEPLDIELILRGFDAPASRQ
jgi:hypothetical protein